MKDRKLLKEAIFSVMRESRYVLSTADIMEGLGGKLLATPRADLVTEMLRNLESEGQLESYWGPKGAPRSQPGDKLF